MRIRYSFVCLLVLTALVGALGASVVYLLIKAAFEFAWRSLPIGLALLGLSCAHPPSPPPPPQPKVIVSQTVPGYWPFCVEEPFELHERGDEPRITTKDSAEVCVSVADVRHWITHVRRAN